jgi:EF-P beta-lysylation protein EpmB
MVRRRRYVVGMTTESLSLPGKGRFVPTGYPDQAAASGPSWRQSMKRAVRSSVELRRMLEIEHAPGTGLDAAEASFPVFAPLEFIARMQRGNGCDPLLLQVLARGDENTVVPGFTADPVGDNAASLLPGLIRKYRSRALLVMTSACAIHCRYCFRRHFPYEETPRSADDWQAALDAIAKEAAIDEVILSGGDPLTLADSTLAHLAERIARIDHVQRLRIHTRLPIVIPQRVTSELLAWLRGTRLTPVVVVHVNHANEIDDATAAALARLVDAGIPVLNQTVLLRDVNDSAAALIALSRKLVDLRVMPYYLHQLDRVGGAAHFEVPAVRGLQIVEQMRAQLPGYAVPRYVQEVAGEASKREVSID